MLATCFILVSCLASSLTLKMDATCSSETSVDNSLSVWKVLQSPTQLYMYGINDPTPMWNYSQREFWVFCQSLQYRMKGRTSGYWTRSEFIQSPKANGGQHSAGRLRPLHCKLPYTIISHLMLKSIYHGLPLLSPAKININEYTVPQCYTIFSW
jgi:hypothetical protein